MLTTKLRSLPTLKRFHEEFKLDSWLNDLSVRGHQSEVQIFCHVHGDNRNMGTSWYVPLEL